MAHADDSRHPARQCPVMPRDLTLASLGTAGPNARAQPRCFAGNMRDVPQAGFDITPDLVSALERVLRSKVATPDPLVILAAYLDSLAKSYGLSESMHIYEDPIERADPPAPAVALINHYLADGAARIDSDALRDRLHDVFVELSQDLPTRRELNKNQPLTDQDLLYVAQIYWNLKGTERRRALPIRPGKITKAGNRLDADIPTEGADDDFATMELTHRRNAKGSHKAAGHRFAKQGALLAVLAAQRMIEGSSSGAPPSLGNADLRRTENVAGKSEVSIVWPDNARVGAAEHGSVVEYIAEPAAASTITSRARACHAIDGFEQDLRQSIERYLLGHLMPEEVFGPEYDMLCARQASADVPDMGTLTQYLYLQEAYDVLLRHPAALPAELAGALRSNVPPLEKFVPVRNRVMKRRPLQPEDLGDTESFIRGFPLQHFRQTDLALVQLGSDTGWQPRRRIGSEPPDLVLHNLPDPDFDETGLLGRGQEINDIVGRLKRRGHRMFTLVGEGGIGKTALALEVCYRLVDDPEPPFDAILWTSLKNERLTPAGVQEISNAVRDIDSAARALGEDLDHRFQGSVGELALALGERRPLLVIDNLETAHGIEVEGLYEALPETVTFLFTSRVGVGQFEKRLSVGPLKEGSAEQLFREFARSCGQLELAELPHAAVCEVLLQLRYSPLAIRWYILSVEMGKPPADTLRNQEELLRFCVGNVVDDLSRGEKLLLEVLRRRERPVALAELAAVSQLEIDDLNRSAQRLHRCSLVVWSRLESVDEPDSLALSSTARAFVRTVTQPDVAEDAVRLDDAYNQDRVRERERLADHGRYLDPNIIFQRSPSDEPLAHLLQKALRESKSGRPQAADATLARARAMNGDYFEVDRVDAMLAGFRKEPAKAKTLYRAAIDNCREDDERAWVGFFFAGLLGGQGRDLSAAIQWAEKAHTVFDSYDTALQLGNLYVRGNRFEEGRHTIQSAMGRTPGKPRFQRIVTTSLVECFRRWSAADLAAGRPHDSLGHALDGTRVGLDLHDSGSPDERLVRAIIEAGVAALKAVRQITELGPEEEQGLASAIQRLDGDESFRVTASWRALEYAVASLTDEVRSRLAPRFTTTTIDAVHKGRIRGTVTNVGPKYGFITHPEFPDNVFFQAGWVGPPTKIEDLMVGCPVEFTPSKNDKGQDQALHVVLTTRDAEPSSEADE